MRPAVPPKPPDRTGTACANGDAVRPANDKVTTISLRIASSRPSNLASVVPPRMRMFFFMSLAELSRPQPAALHRWLSIVGIGEDGIDGLSKAARDLIQSAAVVFGGGRPLTPHAPVR